MTIGDQKMDEQLESENIIYNSPRVISPPKRRQVAAKAVGGKETGKVATGGGLAALAFYSDDWFGISHELITQISAAIMVGLPIVLSFIRRWRASKKELIDFIVEEYV